MYAKTQRDYIYGLRSADKRAAPRTSVTLPILIGVGGIRHNAVLRNLSTDGAMINTSVPLPVLGNILFHCGSVRADATILWRSADGCGIKLAHSLSEQQVSELVARSAAVASWRERHKQAGLLDQPIVENVRWASAA